MSSAVVQNSDQYTGFVCLRTRTDYFITDIIQNCGKEVEFPVYLNFQSFLQCSMKKKNDGVFFFP